MRSRWALLVARVLVILGLALVAQRLFHLPVGPVVRRWWPGALVVLGLGGVLNLVVPVRVARAPLAVAAIGLALLVAEGHPPSRRFWLNAFPLIVLGAGCVLLAMAAGRARPPSSSGPTMSRSVVGYGRRVDWPVKDARLLSLRAAASGVMVTIPADIGPGQFRLEVTGLMADIDIVVPRSWTVILDSHPILARHSSSARAAASSDEADLCVAAWSVLGTVRVRYD